MKKKTMAKTAEKNKKGTPVSGHPVAARLGYLALLYAGLLLLMILEKPLFMLYALIVGCDVSFSLKDMGLAMFHGLYLDIPTTGYFIILPWLLVTLSIWTGKVCHLRRWTVGYYLLVALLLSVVFVVDTSLYPFWKFKLDATIFYYTTSPTEALASVSKGFVVGRLVLILAFALLNMKAFLMATPKLLEPIRKLSYRTSLTLLLVLLAGPLAISIRGGLGESTANVGRVYFSDKEFVNHSAINPCFSLIYSLGKADDYASEFNFYPDYQHHQMMAEIFPSVGPDSAKVQKMLPDSCRLLNTTRPNIIIIIMEGCGGQMTRNAEIMPEYQRLAGDGVLFNHCYSCSFRTDRGLVSTLSGYPSFPTLSVMKLPVKSRRLPCVPASLKAEGYHNSFLYGGDINFTNMQSYLRTGGYDRIVSDVDFPKEQRQENVWGANDDVTFARLFDMVKTQKQTPWSLGFLTLSSHEPWIVNYHRLEEKVPNAFAFTDHCLGVFIDSLKQTPLWKNLLVICIPDHGYFYPDGISRQQHHDNTMLWLGGAIKKPRRIETIMAQSDMAATLLGQLDINHQSYTFSRDVLSPEYLHPFAFFTYKEGAGYVDGTGCTIYDTVGEKIAEDTPNTHTSYREMRAKIILQGIYDDLGAR